MYLIKTFFLFTVNLIVASAAVLDSQPVRLEVSPNGKDSYKVNIETLNKRHSLNLIQPASSVFSENFQVFDAVVDDQGQTVFEPWVPSSDDLKSANEVYVDEHQHAAFKIRQETDTKDFLVEGTFQNYAITKRGSQYFAREAPPGRQDFIMINRSESSSSIMVAGPVIALAEITIVLDKEFCDFFQQDKKKVMDYFTVYMWDFNIRYKSLPSDNISFRVNSIVMIKDKSGQPFIEQARASDGRAEFGRILDKYSFWVYAQRNSLPKADIYPLITKTSLEWGGGLAYVGAACNMDSNAGRSYATLVWNDNADWSSLTVAVHEMGHDLGAWHDDDPGFPGGCEERGFIMSGGNDDRRYFFSSCSDRQISEFVRSESAACLRRIDGKGNPELQPPYSNPKAPTMEELCKRSLQTQKAYIEKKDTYNCRSMRCLRPDENNSGTIWIYQIAPVENTVCGDGGRCFRGRCRPQGYMFKNVGSGLCMKASHPFEFMAPADMFNCPQDGTPLERLVITNTKTGQNLATPFTYDGNKENGEKCLWTGSNEGDTIWTDRCSNNGENGWHGWDFKEVGKTKQFFLVHRITGRCAKPSNRNVGSGIQTYKNCNSNDNDMKWTRYL